MTEEEIVEWDPAAYGERLAPIYDRWFADVPEFDDSIARLVELAGAGPVLELGVGTGRIALPLADRGLEVHGIDVSPAMVRRLREKPGGEAIKIRIGDFADVPADGMYSLVFANSFFNIVSQSEQVRCFQNVARRLVDRGMFVLEAEVPDLVGWAHGRLTSTRWVHEDEVGFLAGKYDPVKQTLMAHNIVVTEHGIRLYPNLTRYAWPSELDLMARLAGLRLQERWGGWKSQAFTEASTRHVSVYVRAD